MTEIMFGKPVLHTVYTTETKCMLILCMPNKSDKKESMESKTHVNLWCIFPFNGNFTMYTTI